MDEHVYIVIKSNLDPGDDWSKFITSAVVGSILELDHLLGFAQAHAAEFVDGRVTFISDVFDHPSGAVYVVVSWQPHPNWAESHVNLIAIPQPCFVFFPQQPPASTKGSLDDNWE